jgi:lipoate-protein ligase A
LVLGSTQGWDLIDRTAAQRQGIEVAKRRSGGGLVHLDPSTDCWIDVYVPARSPLWDTDVGRSFHWLGALWAHLLTTVLASDGTHSVETHQPPGPSRRRPLWCFGALGHGEVTVDGWKVVGLSQRRNRSRIRHQIQVAGSWPSAELASLVDPERIDEQRTDNAGRNPGEVLAGPPPGLILPSPEQLEDRFLWSIGVARPSTTRRVNGM